MKKKNVILSVAVAITVTALAIFYLTRSDVITAKSLSKIPVYSFAVMLILFFISFLILSLVDFLIYRTFTRDLTYLKCLKNTLSGHLGSSVSPYRIGHFPLMAYYQKKDGVRFSDTLTGLIKCQIIYSLTAITVYTAIVVALYFNGDSVLFDGKTVYLWAVIALGLLFHVGAFVLTLIISYCSRIQKFSLNLTVRILSKLKKNFDRENYIAEKTEKLKIFREQISVIGKRFHYYLIPIGLYCVYMLFSSAMPYFSYLFISGEKACVSDFATFYVLTLSSAYITNFVPVPGGAGAAEIVFTLIFKVVVPSGILGSTLVLYRASTFYFVVIAETVWFLIFNGIKTARKDNLKHNQRDKS